MISTAASLLDEPVNIPDAFQTDDDPSYLKPSNAPKDKPEDEEVTGGREEMVDESEFNPEEKLKKTEEKPSSPSIEGKSTFTRIQNYYFSRLGR